MRPIQSLVHGRTRVTPRWALMPLEGFPSSRLPTWPTANVRVLASPRLGAEFVQYLIDLPAGDRGAFIADDAIETFFYVLTGTGETSSGGDKQLTPGSFGLVPPASTLDIRATTPLQLLILRKCYESAPGY